MTRIDYYIEDIMRKIYAPQAKKEQFANDLRSHIEEGLSSGDTESTVLRRMGDPDVIAREFMSESKLTYANFFERFIAFFLDMSICYSVSVPLFFMVLYFPNYSSPDLSFTEKFNILNIAIRAGEVNLLNPSHIEMGILNFVILVSMFISMMGLFLIYFPVLEYRFGKTPGKHLMRLRVINESGASISLGASFLRRLSYYFDVMALDSFFIFFSKKRQRAFDMIAKTVVIRETHLEKSPLFIVIIIVLLLIPVFIVSIFFTHAVLAMCF